MRCESQLRCPVFGVPSVCTPRRKVEPQWPVTAGEHDAANGGKGRQGRWWEGGGAKLCASSAALPNDASDTASDKLFATHLNAFASDPRIQPPPAFLVTAVTAAATRATSSGPPSRTTTTLYPRQGISVHFVDDWSANNAVNTISDHRHETQAELEQRWGSQPGCP